MQMQMSDADEQSIEEHMIKLKGKSSMTQYIISKPIKWGFKACLSFASETGYAYHFKLYLGKKENTEELGIAEGVVLDLRKGLKNL